MANVVPVTTETGEIAIVKVDEGNKKSIIAAIGATVLPILMQTIFQASSGDDGSLLVIWDYLWCAVFSALACPDPLAVALAFKALAGSLVGGVMTGFWTWWVQNGPSTKAIESLRAQLEEAQAAGKAPPRV